MTTSNDKYMYNANDVRDIGWLCLDAKMNNAPFVFHPEYGLTVIAIGEIFTLDENSW